MPYDSNLVGLTSSYNNESVTYNLYETDSATIAVGSSIPSNISRRSIYQNDNGEWVEELTEDKDVFRTAPDIKDEYYNEYERRLKNYSAVISPLDKQILTRNENINAKKQALIDAVNAAVSMGCTVSPAPTTSPNPLVVNGIEVGIGSDVYGDAAEIGVYPNIYDPDSDSPFEDDVNRNLTDSNLGKGYKTIITKNSESAGTNYGRYYVIGGYLAADPTLSPNSSCQSYINQINQLAIEINELRQVPTSLGKVNDLKEAKLDDELSDWAVKKEKKNVTNVQNELNNVINILDSTGL